MFRFPLFIVPGTRGQKLQRCMETGTVLFKILLEEWGGIGYNKYYEVTGEKMDIMCEGGTL